MKNCLNNQSALGSGSIGVTNCGDCSTESYYFTVIGESEFEVPNSNPISFTMIDDGIEPMEHVVTRAGKIIVEFTGNVKRIIAGVGHYENCFIACTLNGILNMSTYSAISSLNKGEQYDISFQSMPIDVIAGDIVMVCAATNDSTSEEFHSILNHNMRIIYIE